MSVEHIEILVEEPSTEAALRLLLPKVVGELSFEIYPCQCKDERLGRLPERLRGYASWIPDTWRIVIVVDRDNDGCEKLKARIEKMARAAGLVTRTTARKKPYVVVSRLAIEELEAWFFGDWAAVRAAYPRVPPTITSQAKYRDPDAIRGGTWEALEHVLQRAGYFKTGLRKIEVARAVAEHMDPVQNISHSFQVLRTALLEMVPA